MSRHRRHHHDGPWPCRIHRPVHDRGGTQTESDRKKLRRLGGLDGLAYGGRNCASYTDRLCRWGAPTQRRGGGGRDRLSVTLHLRNSLRSSHSVSLLPFSSLCPSRTTDGRAATADSDQNFDHGRPSKNSVSFRSFEASSVIGRPAPIPGWLGWTPAAVQRPHRLVADFSVKGKQRSAMAG